MALRHQVRAGTRQQYVQFYQGGRLKDADGHDVRLPTRRGLEKAKLDANVGITQLVYQSDQALRARWQVGHERHAALRQL